MFRMIKAEWYKMTKSKGFKILCVIALLFGLLTAGFCTIIDEEMIKDATGNEISEEQNRKHHHPSYRKREEAHPVES